MFFVKELSRTMTLHPSFFNPQIRDYLYNELLRSVEGTLQGDYYVICIFDNSMVISEGMVIPGTGRVEYTVNYKAVCFKPFRGEVVDGYVTEAQSTGIFVEVGPMTVFVSGSMIPDYMRFDGTSLPPQWTDGADQNQSIYRGTQVRMRIRGMRPEGATMQAIATINEDFLGVVTKDEPDIDEENM